MEERAAAKQQRRNLIQWSRVGPCLYMTIAIASVAATNSPEYVHAIMLFPSSDVWVNGKQEDELPVMMSMKWALEPCSRKKAQTNAYSYAKQQQQQTNLVELLSEEDEDARDCTTLSTAAGCTVALSQGKLAVNALVAAWSSIWFANLVAAANCTRFLMTTTARIRRSANGSQDCPSHATHAVMVECSARTSGAAVEKGLGLESLNLQKVRENVQRKVNQKMIPRFGM